MGNNFEDISKVFESREREPKKITDVIFMAGVAFAERDDASLGNRYYPETGGESRHYAVELLAQELEGKFEGEEKGDYVVLVSGGPQTTASSEKISRAQTSLDSLTSNHGIPAEKVVALDDLGGSFGNISSLLDYLGSKEETLDPNFEITVVTENFHIPRYQLIFVSEMLRLYRGLGLSLPKEVIDSEVIPVLNGFVDGNMSGVEAGNKLTNLVLEYAKVKAEDLPLRFKIRASSEIIRDKGEQLSRKKGAAERYAGFLENDSYLLQLKKREVGGILSLLRGQYARSNQDLAERDDERKEMLSRFKAKMA